MWTVGALWCCVKLSPEVPECLFKRFLEPSLSCVPRHLSASRALLVSDSRQGFKLLASGQFGPQKAFWVSPKVSWAPLSSGDMSALEISRWRRERFGVK